MVWKKHTGQNKFMNSHISKEALFNEIKGSLFEYLVAGNIARQYGLEEKFIQSIPSDYLKILMGQDLMIRKFYPEMLSFLSKSSLETSQKIIELIDIRPSEIFLVGKLLGEYKSEDFGEADILIMSDSGPLPVSLKLNKKNSFVNTKSGGIKSFFKSYFPWLSSHYQDQFNLFVDQEFLRMGHELYEFHELPFEGDFKQWVRLGFSELPGELSLEERDILKNYYARISKYLHLIMETALNESSNNFLDSCLKLIGFTDSRILQVTCFHDFHNSGINEISTSSLKNLDLDEKLIKLKPFHQTASVEIDLGGLELHLRVKPMNKFTTTAIKINCAIKRLK
jgi:hypothetical protein